MSVTLRSLRRLAGLQALALAVASASLAAQAAPTPPAAPTPTAAAPATPAAPAAPAYRATYDEAMQIGRAVTRQAFAGEVDSLVATADPGAPADLRTRLLDGVSQISLQLGAERRMIAERVMNVEGRIEYQRTAEFENVPVPLVFRVIMGAKGTWRGFTASTEDQLPGGDEVKP